MTTEAPAAWDERIAELLAEGNELRALVAEILGAFQHEPEGSVAVVLPPRRAAWRERLEAAS